MIVGERTHVQNILMGECRRMDPGRTDWCKYVEGANGPFTMNDSYKFKGLIQDSSDSYHVCPIFVTTLSGPANIKL